MLIRVTGIFFRSIVREHASAVLAGSRRAGRYSRAGEPTLYLSASREGVAAAMLAHRQDNAPLHDVLSLHVDAADIFDLRDVDACVAAGIDRDRAFEPWQERIANGGEAPSWQASDRLRSLGANGLIDPSRTAPGLWHLVLFRWNVPGGPEVRVSDPL